MYWRIRSKTLALVSPIWMGIVNVTPDSFSDGGEYYATTSAVEQALRLIQNGAGIIDIGGESTRPGSVGVSAEEELLRVLPVLRQLRRVQPDIFISVDTTKASVAEKVLAEGADIINDVSGLSDSAMLSVLKETGAGYCLMHTRGTPDTMQDNPQYDDVVEDVFAFLQKRCSLILDAGISLDTIVVDPGLGFGKTSEHNWQLVENIAKFHELAVPILAGHSRKRFIAERYADRDAGTQIVSQQLLKSGVHILRVHSLVLCYCNNFG